MRKQLQQQVESWRTGPKLKIWSGPTGKIRRNEYNGLTQVIDRDPIIFEPKSNPNWTFESTKWLSPDSHHKYLMHLADPEKRELLDKNGWIDNNFEYNINKDGFRHDGGSDTSSFLSNQGGVLYLGCSITFGIGVPLEDTWSWKLHQRMFPDKRYMNMGLPGQGVESYYRILKSYIGISKPEIIIGTYPWASGRSEVFDPNQSGWVQQFMNMAVGHLKITLNDEYLPPDTFTRMSLYAPETSILRYMKHHDAIRWTCQENDATLLWLNIQEMASLVTLTRNTEFCDSGRFVPEWDFGRDLMHHGSKGHDAMSYKIQEELEKCLS